LGPADRPKKVKSKGVIASEAKQSKAKQSKAKQSKAKQSKAKQSKAKQSNLVPVVALPIGIASSLRSSE
jgi:hypothetical protein